MLGHPTAQRPQAAGQRATRQGTLHLELLAHGHDGLLQPAYSVCAVVSAVWTTSFAAVSSATAFLSSEQKNEDKLRQTSINLNEISDTYP